jgi:hypothetical protein
LRSAAHFTPTRSSWLNLVERLVAKLTTKKLRRGAHRSVRQLNADIPHLDHEPGWVPRKPGLVVPSLH